MAVTVGRLRACPVLGLRFVALVHNTIRGAAGNTHPHRRTHEGEGARLIKGHGAKLANESLEGKVT